MARLGCVWIYCLLWSDAGVVHFFTDNTCLLYAIFYGFYSCILWQSPLWWKRTFYIFCFRFDLIISPFCVAPFIISFCFVCEVGRIGVNSTQENLFIWFWSRLSIQSKRQQIVINLIYLFYSHSCDTIHIVNIADLQSDTWETSVSLTVFCIHSRP